MISDKYGLVHPEEEVRRVVARHVPKGSPPGRTLLAQAGDPVHRAALERALAAKRALLGAAGPQEAPEAGDGGKAGERGRLWRSGRLWERLRKWCRRNWPTSRRCGAGNARLRCWVATLAHWCILEMDDIQTGKRGTPQVPPGA